MHEEAHLLDSTCQIGLSEGQVLKRFGEAPVLGRVKDGGIASVAESLARVSTGVIVECHTLKYLILECEYLLQYVHLSIGFFENFKDFSGN
jgi:hypothetical protein